MMNQMLARPVAGEEESLLRNVAVGRGEGKVACQSFPCDAGVPLVAQLKETGVVGHCEWDGLGALAKKIRL